MTPTLNSLVDEALFAYADLARLDPRSWGDRPVIDDLNESRELDPSGLTTFMLLRGLVDYFAAHESFSAKRILADFDGFSAELVQIRRVVGMVENPDVVATIDEFSGRLRAAAARMRARDRDGVERLLDDRESLSVIRRDALRSLARLEARQFSWGEPDPRPLKCNTHVYEFWNVNSLLAALRDQALAGVSLILIRDPEDARDSFFCWAVRNGGSITVLTDREQAPHPDFARMRRDRGRCRALESRSARNWFPYHLLGLKRDAEGDLRVADRTALVPYNTAAVKLCALGELGAGELLWAGLMLDLINERYGAENRRLPELAYTGEMVVAPEALIGQRSALVAAGHYRPLVARALVKADVTAESTRDQWAAAPVGHNEWMIAEYGAKVPDEVLNPVGDRASKALEAENAEVFGAKPRGKLADVCGAPSLRSLSPVSFGSAAEIERDRLWVARRNQCAYVQGLAEDEFLETKDEVLAWCRARVEARRDRIVEAAAAGEWLMPAARYGAWQREPEVGPADCLTQYGGDWAPRYWDPRADEFFFSRETVKSYYRKDRRGTRERRWGVYWDCAVERGVRAAVYTRIEPVSAESLAELFGVTSDELPKGLRHWRSRKRCGPYGGNSILSRLDPSDWVLHNPWTALPMTVYVGLCAATYHALRGRLGLPPRPVPDPEPQDE